MNFIALITATVIIAAVAVFLYLQNNITDLTSYEVKSGDINAKMKLIHLSDLHSKPSAKVIKKVKELKPDMIVITGDYINDKCKNREKMMNYAKLLCNIAPVFYITGNHERRLEKFDEIMDELKSCGFCVLLNEAVTINIKSNTVNILGLDENQANFDDYKARKNGTFVYKDMSAYFKELEKKAGFKLVLSHYPENFKSVKENNYSQYSFDLQLSGHAHGGQFILPFAGPIYSPGQGIFPKYARGSFGERPKMIVSRGIGNAEFPFRLFNHPEIVEIILESSDTD